MFSFIETRLFTRLVQEYLGDDEYRELQKSLMDNPETGNVIPGFRWHTQASLARAGTREARWISRDLLYQEIAERDLDVNDVSEEHS